jgi:uncharacterized protein
VPLNPVEAAKWNLIARGGGKSDPELDQMLEKLTPEERAQAEEQAKGFKPVAVTLATTASPPKFGPRRIK